MEESKVGDNITDTSDSDISVLPSRKRRKSTLRIWKDYIEYNKRDGKEWANSKHSKKSGTGIKHLINRRITKGRFAVDKELGHLKMASMIIKSGVTSLNFVKADIFDVYNQEKEKLRSFLGDLSCRFSLLISYPDYDAQYIFLIVSFIDDAWQMKSKTLKFLKYKDAYGFIASIKSSHMEWNIDKKLCSIVVDDCDLLLEGEDSMEMNEINRWLRAWGLLPFVGHICHISLLLCDLKDAPVSVARSTLQFPGLQKMRKSVCYVRKASVKELDFEEALDTVNEKLGKNLGWQDFPRNNCGDLKPLKSMLEFKEAFYELEKSDREFKSTAICECFEALNVAVQSLSSVRYRTVNEYFPKVCYIYAKWRQWFGNDYKDLHKIAYDLYSVREFWDNCNMVLAVAAVLDPRFKLDVVKAWYKEIYGSPVDEHLKICIDYMNDIYTKYAKVHSNNDKPSTFGDGSPSTLKRPSDYTVWPSRYIENVNDTDLTKSELDHYLAEPRFPLIEEFDILAWWRVHVPKFPILAKMERDFLAIPEIPGCALKTEIVNVVRSEDLDFDIRETEALICTKSWLESPKRE